VTDTDLAPRPGMLGAAVQRLPALAHGHFRAYSLGVLLSSGGGYMFQVVTAWLVYELAKPPLNRAIMLGVLGFARTIPMFAFVLVAGVISDRIGSRRILLITNLLSAVLAAGFALLAFGGLLNVWIVLAFAFLMGSAIAFNRPAFQAVVHELVGSGDTHSGVALMALIQNLMRILAPLPAGLLLARGDGGAVLLIVCAGYLAMVALLCTIHLERVRIEQSSIVSSLHEVFAYIRSERLVRTLMLVETIPGFFALPFGAFLPIFAGSIYGRGAAGLGVMQAVVGAGALAGSLLLVLLAGVRRRGLLLVAAIASFGAALVVFSLVHAWLLALLMLAIVGGADSLYIFTINGLLLTRAPEHLRGRVMSVFTLADSGMSPLGSVVVGLFAGIVGAPAALAASGATVTALVLGVAARVPRLRAV
jgi:MFS family permease